MRFLKFSYATITIVFLLILAGGIVRSTGSGMGCPDWPKCFGKVVPPTDVSELPENYQEIYSNKRKQKNQRLAKVLRKIGFADFATKLENDQSIYEEGEFNALNTWIEYINRLLGALTGIFILITLILAWRLKKVKPKVFTLTLWAFILVIIEGLLGAIVVSTNLIPFLVTIHLVLALFVALLLIWANIECYQIEKENIKGNKNIPKIAFLGFITILIQIILGTQVREKIDQASEGISNKSFILDNLGWIFESHKTFAIVVSAIALYLSYLIYKNLKNRYFQRLNYALIALVFAQFLTGILLNNFGFPGFAQVLHILLSSLMFSVCFAIWISSIKILDFS